MDSLTDGHWWEGLKRLTSFYSDEEAFIARLDTHPDFRVKADRYRQAVGLFQATERKRKATGWTWTARPSVTFTAEEATNIEALIKYTQTITFIKEA